MSNTANKIFIDASTFMGMHSENQELRSKSICLMSSLFEQCVYMNLEQVGICDDWVWSYPRHIQDAYYPFMDCLHSDMDIRRIGYSKNDMSLALNEVLETDSRLSVQQALLIAQVRNETGVLFTHDQTLHSVPEFSPFLGRFDEVISMHYANDQIFNKALDELYQESLSLTI